MDTFSDMMHREHQQHLSGAADLASTPLPTAAAATAATTATTATAFEYSFPLTDGGDDDTESNKSTPYYTPLEFFQSSFEFPSPRSDNKTHGQAQHAHSPSDSRDDRTKQLPLAPAVAAAAAVASGSHSPLPTLPPAAGTSRDSAPADSHIAEHERAKKAPPPSPATPKLITSVAGKSMQATSPPVVNRKIRRFSLYERRSCSPQHLLIKSVGAAAESSARGDEFVNDKENTKPHFLEKKEDSIHLVSNSGSNSPIAILDETASPKILAASEANMFGNSRLAYSPKLLASINNLHLSGSPLGVISSAGYKNGNYFKFPEIDHVVQELASAADDSSGHLDNQTRSRQRNIAEKCGSLSPAPSKARCKSTSVEHSTSKAAGTDARSQRADAASLSHRTAGELRRSQTELAKSAPSANKTTVDSRKNRKNKNNLTIRITDVPSSVGKPLSVSPSPSPSTKPKTPTIKSTKEKALSLDSAAGESELTIIVTSRRDSYASCDEIDVQPLPVGSSHWMQQGTPNASQSQTIKISEPSVTSSRSTSLSQLSDVSAASALLGKPLSGQRLGDALSMSTRRRVACANTDWYQRNQYPYHLGKGLSVENGKSPSVVQESVGGVSNAAKAPEVTLSHDDKLPVPGQGQGKVIPNSSSGTAATLSASQRGAYKHNPILHASNTNLKTLPEFLTLVEFSTTGAKDNESPYKQKSMDLPSSTVTTVRLKNTATGTSSTNLLQRRGSNQSLTLNLHGSCSNLLGNCRSGLSLSNYSLGSVTNSTSNLNSKSSGHLDLGATNASQMISARNPSVPTAQVAKQTLFRRRGSNHSLTLTNLTAASCGNLNTFASQNSLNVDRLQPLQTGVTRTMSFITPTKSTVSSVLQKRGLLERRGSNQSLTLNMGGSFGGVGTERNVLPTQPTNLYLSEEPDAEAKPMTLHPTTNCAQHRKFFSSESLNKANNQFSDLNQTHKRNANQVCFGSVSDLKPSDYADVNKPGGSREHFDFQESTVCTCTGVRNIVTRPLSPQTTSEEFKIYLANIQMLQNASNALNQQDLIKLNYIFDNSYRSNSKSIVEQPLPVLNVHGSREAETPPGLLSTSEDHEVAARFQDVVGAVLQTIQPDDVEQKRMFCDLHKEFWDLPLNHQEKPMVFGSQTKNRYKTILPNENSRVILEKERNILAEFLAHYDFLRLPVDLVEPRIAGTDEVPYINANYIKGPDYTSKCYVATQGPLPNTIFEFWLMVYLNTHRHFQNAKKLSSPITKNGEMLQQYDQKIVMLTNFLENNRQKCSAYFPVELHEIFVTSARHEVAPPSASLVAFLNEYLQSSDDDASPEESRPTDDQSKASAGIEVLRAALTAEQRDILPQNSNFFAMKNVGIVRKNGFSIRKLVILYCVNIPTKEPAAGSTELLMQKFCCYHYWYPDWPDHRSPRDINTLLDICVHVLNLGKCELEFETFACTSPAVPPAHVRAQQVQLYQQDIFNSVQPLPIIHCSAGIGRTGCFTAILNGIRQLRQSLAYSLTSMAAAVSKRNNAEQVLSPVDFCLPASFLAQPHALDDHLNNDTDNSFTRNTLLYLKYILQKQTTEQSLTDEQSAGDAGRRTPPTAWQIPSLNELPKMPDVFVDILGIVCNLRLQRGGMVQNSEQYELIHRAICLYMKRAFALKRF